MTEQSIIMQIVEHFGLPTALTIALLWFIYKAVWPFFTKQLEYQRTKSEESQAAFLAALERRDAIDERFRDTIAENTSATREQTSAIRELSNEVRAQRVNGRNS